MEASKQPRTRLWLFVLAGLAIAMALAFFVSPYASSSPDGLEKVAAEHRIDTGARESSGPMKDYTVANSTSVLSTGVAGLIGVVVTFMLGAGLFLVLRATRRDPDPADAHAGIG